MRFIAPPHPLQDSPNRDRLIFLYDAMMLHRIIAGEYPPHSPVGELHLEQAARYALEFVELSNRLKNVLDEEAKKIQQVLEILESQEPEVWLN